MKKPLRHKAKKNFRHGISLILCMLLTVSCYSAPVLGAEPDETATAVQTEAISENELSTDNGVKDETQDKTEEAVKTVTVTFQIGMFGTETITVEKGEYLYNIPTIPELPSARVLGWYNSDGQQAYPGSVRAEEDAVYTARWSRRVSDILNTYDHNAYISGYSNGMFKPNSSVTRAEAAQMLYSLLIDKNREKKTFSDVGDKWYAEAVGTMAGLGIIRGYSDGTFKPGREITRAEFVTMAINCDTIAEGELNFSDVSASSWAAPYIATAAANGWISGFNDGTFHPNDKITRAQAVTIINKMLGRSADAQILEKTDAKNFYDVFPGNWAYGNILEAATGHSYYQSGGNEVWTSYEQDTEYPESDCWIKDGSSRYYLDAETRKFLRGEHTIDGKKYLFDSSTGAAYTGFKTEGAWQRYYKNGLMMNDISSLGVTSGPYFIKVYKNSNYLIVYAKSGSGKYDIPVKAMRVSCGNNTPVGTFYTPDRYRWLQMVGDTWAQWCTQIQGNYLFHSVPNWTQNNADLEVDEFNHLGDTRSLGCIRLNCRDAKWIFDNCVLGTKVTITTSESSGPLSKPDGIQIPSWHTWDPTDPTAYWRCKQKGCH